jgi:Kef-type K+ transport system membrane component KefB
MIKIVRPFLMRVGEVKGSKEALSKPVVAIFFIVLLLSAYATEVIGIHALFGAFMAGAIMPEGSRFRTAFIEKSKMSLLCYCCLYFLSILDWRTQIGLLNDPQLWMITIGIILVAVIGKFAGSTLWRVLWVKAGKIV